MKDKGLRLRFLLIPGCMLLFLFIVVPVALAQAGDVVHLTGELQGDQYATGNTVILDEGAVVHGDLLAAGQTVIVYGNVDGSIIAAGYRIEVHGTVGHAVRIAGGGDFPGTSPRGGLIVTGDIAGDLVAAGGSLDVYPEAKVGGNTYSFANTATLGGTLTGNLTATGSTVRITGSVGGDAELECSPCQVMDGATIGGKLTYTSQGDADISGIVHGAITHLLPEAKSTVPPVQRFGQDAWWWIRGVLGLLAVGALLLWLVPRASAAVEEALRTRPGHSVGWGALALFVLPIALLVVLILSVVLGLLVRVWPFGAGLAVLVLGIYFVALYVSHIFVGYTIGRVIFRALKWDGARGARFWEMILGVILLSLLGLIPILGGWVVLATLLFGMGAIVVAWWRSRHRPVAVGTVETGNQ